MTNQIKLNELSKKNIDPNFNSCADIYIMHNSDNFIYYDNLIDVGVDFKNNPCYIETELTEKDIFHFNNKNYFFSYELNLPSDVLFTPIQNFTAIVSSYINEGFVLRVSDEDNYNILMLDTYDENNKELKGKKYCKFKDTEEISVFCENFKDFIENNSFLEKMYFLKRKEKHPTVSMLRIKIQMECYILNERDKNANLGTNVFKRLDYSNKNNVLFLLEHKLLMVNRIEHLINYKGMWLSDDIQNTYREYTELIDELVNSDFNNMNPDIIFKILDLEEQVLEYISKYYKEHD